MNRKTREILELIIGLEAVEFIGVCKILGIKLISEEEVFAEDGEINAEIGVRDFTELWADVSDKVDALNRTQKRNLLRLLRAAVKGKE